MTQAYLQKEHSGSSNTVTDSLRSSRFLFLQAKRGKCARALGKKEQKSRSGEEGRGRKGNPTFLLLFAQCPRALAPVGLKEKETTATQAR